MFLRLRIYYDDGEAPCEEVFDHTCIRRVRSRPDGRCDMELHPTADPDEEVLFVVDMAFDALWGLLSRVE